MSGLATLYQSSIGKKVIMAVSGALLLGFIVMHMYGNLKAFQGPDYFNHYAEGLRELGAPVFGHTHVLWLARFGLLAAALAHVWSALVLSRQRGAARPMGYHVHKKQESTAAALTIRWGGVAIFLFVVYHLMHFTWGTRGVHPDFIHGDAYHNLVVGFQFVPAALAYLVAVTALGFHLYHGTWSMLQTLGLSHTSYQKKLQVLSLGLAAVIAIGFAAVPVGVLTGIIE